MIILQLPFHSRVVRPLQNMIGWRFYDFVYQRVLSGINTVKIRKNISLLDTGVRYSTSESERYLFLSNSLKYALEMLFLCFHRIMVNVIQPMNDICNTYVKQAGLLLRHTYVKSRVAEPWLSKTTRIDIYPFYNEHKLDNSGGLEI